MPLRHRKEISLLSRPRLVEKAEADADLAVGDLHPASRPAWDIETVESCDRIYGNYVHHGRGDPIPQSEFCDVPKWVFAEYLVEFKNIYLFGDHRASLSELRPTQLSLNLIGWNHQALVCHASPIEAIFHAIVDDAKLYALDCPFRSMISLVDDEPDSLNRNFYFGIDYRATPFAPWRNGVLYLFKGTDLPTDCPMMPFESPAAIRPVACIPLSPVDWPMLDKVDSVDIVAQNKRSSETYRGFPWRSCEDVHPFHWRRPIVEEVRQEIEANLARRLSLAYLGRLAGCSPFSLLRFFRAEFGVSPHEYQNRLRMNLGRSLLRGGLQLAEVAAETGFFDQSHFTAGFRRSFGLTPGQYIQAQYSPITRSGSRATISA